MAMKGVDMRMVEKLTSRIEGLKVIDAVVDPFWKKLGSVMHVPALASLLSGTWLGHPLHPALTEHTRRVGVVHGVARNARRPPDIPVGRGHRRQCR
jgi:hypothetical protein